MKKLYLIGDRQVELDNHEELVLNYYIVKEENGSRPLFGIEITGQSGNEFTREYTGAISGSAGFVRRLLEKLYLGVVTPIGLIEQVDQLITMYT